MFELAITDIKFIFIFSYFAYLYFRKRHRTFINIALCGYVSIFICTLFGLDRGVKALVLISGIVVAFILSFKELESLEKNDVNAKSFLNPDVLDFVVLFLLFIVWAVIKNYY